MIKIILLFLMMLFVKIGFSQTLTGKIEDAISQKPIEGANIAVHENNIGTFTDINGDFSLILPKEGIYTLEISSLGYKSINLKVTADTNITILDKILISPISILIESEVVVTALRMSRSSFSTPSSISILNSSVLKKQLARSTPETLEEATGVYIQKTNHGGGSPIIRGLMGNQILLLVDGIRLNNSTYRYGPNQYLNTIDPFIIDKVEVVKGSGSVNYGSDALGGVVQILTKEPEFSNNGMIVEADAYSRWMSNGMEKTGRTQFLVAEKNTSILSGITFSHFGDILAGGNIGFESPTGYKGISADLKLKQKIGQSHLLTFAYQYNEQNDVPRFDKIMSGYYRFHFNPQTRQLGYIKFESALSDKWNSKILYTLAYSQSDEKREIQKKTTSNLTIESDLIETYNASIEVQSRPHSMWYVNYGFDYYNDQVQSKKIESILGVDQIERGYYPNGSKAESFAFFTSHILEFNFITLNLGIRYNLHKINVEDHLAGNFSLKPKAFVYNISMLQRLSKTLNVYLSTNTSFRAPNINDLSSFGIFNYGIEIPNAKLNPEKSQTFETGLKLNSRKSKASFTIYHTTINDMIERIESSFMGMDSIDGEKIYQKSNFSKAKLYGVEGEYHQQLNSSFSLSGNFCYTHGQSLSLNEPLTRIPPIFGRIGLEYSTQKNVWCKFELAGAIKQDRLSSSDILDTRIPPGGTPGWLISNLKVGFENKYFNTIIGINNLFNEVYQTHGSGVHGYGRSLFISINIGAQHIIKK